MDHMAEAHFQLPPLKVAVIGAGVSGLLAARELQRVGLNAVVYERSDQIGGTWAYTPEVEEEDPLGLDPNRKIVHSSLYKSLRTNFPPALMEFMDYPFNVGGGFDRKTYFATHEEILQFLKNFVAHFGLEKLIRFSTRVVRVEAEDVGRRWIVESKKEATGGMGRRSDEELFDAVVVCNGHNTQPRLANVAGIKRWPGKQIHSHNYRVPKPYKDQVVVVIGGGPSAYDIAFDISKVAKEVHISTRHPQAEVKKFGTCNNMWQHLQIKECHENGEVCFEDGASIVVDTIIHASGFKYDFSFLKTNGVVTVDDNRVGPLYKHVFPPQLAPTLSFVGIPKQTVNFRMIELQAKWVAQVLSGKVALPSKEEMLADVELHYLQMEKNGIPKHHTHTIALHSYYKGFGYMDWLAAQIGLPPADEELKVVLDRLIEFNMKKAQPQPLKVAVIGAGVSGLLAARELRRVGLNNVVVYEKSGQIGGTWVYTPEVEDDDPLGLDPNRKIVHSSLYKSLRANLPPTLMEFMDYPFNVNVGGDFDRKTYFASHEEVLQFLKNFVAHFGLEKLVRFNTRVVRVEAEDGGRRWIVETEKNMTGGLETGSEEEMFDAVVVCNGHNTQPRLANVPGIKGWPGKQIHSHNYRISKPYKDKVVVVIGGGPSAYDIAFDISIVAKEVHISTRNPHAEVRKSETSNNVWQHLQIKECHENGEVCFEDGASIIADIILHATGFYYDFSFLKTNGVVTVDDNQVGPLYKHVFRPQLAPTLSFVGIPKQTVNFLVMELQAKWIAEVLAGKVALPSKEEMMTDIELHYQQLEKNGIPKHHTHNIALKSFEYVDWLAAQVGLPPADEELKVLLERVMEFTIKNQHDKKDFAEHFYKL
ncbi:OLC1v1008167C2 [Oldenlandia corymbosa var. corymbosa]|uniref:Flavin-containing monooxygenase n=1 Tax=Oldenlandia corymbosa var. corymbosa TaxID=529605 RepID=A0AAV1DMG0_OLDCO|nr:OLC1v1008167C2 [Oldenlandia corymbosa var. corymbosa]